MAKFTTITKKKDDVDDEHTVSASEFINRLVSSQRQTEQLPSVDKTEQPK